MEHSQIGIKRETDVKTETIDIDENETQELQIVETPENETNDEVETVVLQNIALRENGELPIILNNYPESSDGNLQIDTDDNVIHTYIIE